MQVIKELFNLIQVDKLKANGLWDVFFEPDSKLRALSEQMIEGNIDTDEAAQALLYSQEDAKPKYYNLKKRLKQRLVDIIASLDIKQSKLNDRQSASVECNKQWAVASILLSRGARNSAVEILEETLEKTLYYEFSDISIQMLTVLRLHYGVIQGNRAKFEYYNNLFQECKSTWTMESETEDMYISLMALQVGQKAADPEWTAKADQYYRAIAPYLEKNSSFRLHLCGRLLRLMASDRKNDYLTTAQICEDAIAFFKQKKFDTRLALQAFYSQLIVCYIQLKSFDKGQKIIADYQSLFPEGSFNWFKLQELYFLLAMHSKRYAEAYAVYVPVKEKLRAKEQPPQIREMWKIYEAYLQYLLYVNKIGSDPSGQKFRVGKFGNEIPVFSKDKRGMNIPILIVQILFSIASRNYGQTIDRIEAIEKYCSRYLKKDDTFRSNCIIRMLLQIPSASFHREAVIRRTSKLFGQLRSTPLEVAGQAFEVEIIPYEDLWEIVLETLENKVVQWRSTHLMPSKTPTGLEERG
jgi:hypothetical protein